MEAEARVPVIQLWRRLLVPLQGDISDGQAATLTEDVLDAIKTADAEGLVIDITGVWMMDSHLCAKLTELAAAAQLMGTRTVVCGMRPEIAMTLQTMGVEFGAIDTALTLEDALQRLGIVPRELAPYDSGETEVEAAQDTHVQDTYLLAPLEPDFPVANEP